MTRYRHLTAIVLTFGGLLGVAQADDPLETAIDVVATYSIDSDTFKLVRYSFATNDFMEVGVVQTDSGVVMTDCESLAFVPAGPDIGIYSVPTKG
ncbi:MAG: hypothetical protein ACYTBR_16815, partial [Planctomycetota bacterium]